MMGASGSGDKWGRAPLPSLSKAQQKAVRSLSSLVRCVIVLMKSRGILRLLDPSGSTSLRQS